MATLKPCEFCKGAGYVILRKTSFGPNLERQVEEKEVPCKLCNGAGYFIRRDEKDERE